MNNQNFFISYSSLTERFELSGYTLQVITLLIKASNYITKSSYMSKKTMAAKCSCSVATVTRALRELANLNIITIAPCMYDRKNKEIKRQTSNDYFVNFSLLAEDGLQFKVAGESSALSGSELTVYNYIAKRIGNRQSFSLSRREIAKQCNLSTSTVYYAIVKLEKKMLIAVTRTKKDNLSQCNKFSLIYNEGSDVMKKEVTNPALANKEILSANGLKLFNCLQQCENYDSFCNEEQLSKRCGIHLPALNAAVKELEHYQLLTCWHNDIQRKPQKWHYTLSAMLSSEYFPNALPPLPRGVTNGEPFNVILKDTVFALNRFTPHDIKLYSALIYVLQNNSQATVNELSSVCKLNDEAFNTSLSKFINIKYFVEQNDYINLANSTFPCWPKLLNNQHFKLSATQFTIIIFLYLVSDKNNKIFITSRSIAEYCKLPVATVNGVINQLVNKSFIKTSIFYQSDGGVAGRIIELVGKNDTG